MIIIRKISVTQLSKNAGVTFKVRHQTVPIPSIMEREGVWPRSFPRIPWPTVFHAGAVQFLFQEPTFGPTSIILKVFKLHLRRQMKN